MAYVKLTRPGGTPVVLNTDHVVQFAPAPEGGATAGPPDARTRIDYVTGRHQDVTESMDSVEQRFRIH